MGVKKKNQEKENNGVSGDRGTSFNERGNPLSVLAAIGDGPCLGGLAPLLSWGDQSFFLHAADTNVVNAAPDVGKVRKNKTTSVE